MTKPFGVDLAKSLGLSVTNSSSVSPPSAATKRRGAKAARPGLPPTVRGLPWSKMLRSFREKSA